MYALSKENHYDDEEAQTQVRAVRPVVRVHSFTVLMNTESSLACRTHPNQ
jgi:hypothetical protein